MASKKLLTVDAGNHPRLCCPVTTVLSPEEVSDPERISMSLAGVDTACQAIVNGKEVKLTWLIRRLKENKKKRFEVKTRRSIRTSAGGVELVDDTGNKVSIFISGKLFTEYYYGKSNSRPFMHPIIGPYGKTVTSNGPIEERLPGENGIHDQDHSIWTGFGDINGVDHWSKNGKVGKVIHRRFKELRQGPVFGRIIAVNDWVDSEDNKMCEEIREITVYNLPLSIRMIDYNVTFKANQGTIQFNEPLIGGPLCVKVAHAMNVTEGGTIRNSFGGVNEEETSDKPAHWCDYSGRIEGKNVGIALFDHPSNYRHPTCWNVGNDGLIAASPFSLSNSSNENAKKVSYTLPENETLSFRYRIIIHKGDAIEAEIDERYHDYVNPPFITS